MELKCHTFIPATFKQKFDLCRLFIKLQALDRKILHKPTFFYIRDSHEIFLPSMRLSDLPAYLMRGALSSLRTAAAVEDLKVTRFGDLQNERFRDEATFCSSSSSEYLWAGISL